MPQPASALAHPKTAAHPDPISGESDQHDSARPVLPISYPRADHDQFPIAIRDDLRRIESTLLEAELAGHPSDRYLSAHLAALRTGALIVRLRSAQVRTPSHLWSLVSAVASEFAEWAGFFAATEDKREAVRSGATTIVSEREAADLLRDAGAFYQQLHARLTAETRRDRT